LLLLTGSLRAARDRRKRSLTRYVQPSSYYVVFHVFRVPFETQPRAAYGADTPNRHVQIRDAPVNLRQLVEHHSRRLNLYPFLNR